MADLRHGFCTESDMRDNRVLVRSKSAGWYWLTPGMGTTPNRAKACAYKPAEVTFIDARHYPDLELVPVSPPEMG